MALGIKWNKVNKKFFNGIFNVDIDESKFISSKLTIEKKDISGSSYGKLLTSPEFKPKYDKLTTNIDMLKFAKNKRLYEEYAQKALREDKIDVKNMLIDHLLPGNENEFNNEIKETEKILSANVNKALLYRHKAEENIYGYHPDDSLTDILESIPNDETKDTPLLSTSHKKENYSLSNLSKNIKNPIKSPYEINSIKNKESLPYFITNQELQQGSEEYLSDKVENNIKVKMLNHEAQDFYKFSMTQDYIDKSNQHIKTSSTSVDFRGNADSVRYKMIDMLSGLGLHDIQISYNFTGNNASVKLNINEDKRIEIEQKLKQMSIR